MSKFHTGLGVAIAFGAVPATAEQLQIVTDIQPIQSLVQMVAGDFADVHAIVQPGATPHGYALRPSDARALQDSDLVVWIGPGLTPWLADPVETLAGNAAHIELGDVEGTLQLETRSGANFAEHAHDHDDHDDDHDDHDEAKEHDDHEEHGHDEHDEAKDHDDHDHDEHDEAGGHDDHDHGDFDPHVWLSPDNAMVWIGFLTEAMIDLSPENADEFRTNSVAAIERLESAKASASGLLSDVGEAPFVVYHDAFQYFENSFEISAAGALSLSDATPPSAARIAEIRDLVADEGIVCAFSEPQFDPGLIETVFGSDAEVRVAVLDPLGSELTPGSDLYPELIVDLAKSVSDCLS